jgi:thiol-disulfide isomerase/thioredoxin
VRLLNRNSKTLHFVGLGIFLHYLSGAQIIPQASNSPATSSAAATPLSSQLTELMHSVDDAETAYVKADSANSSRLWNAYASLNATNVPKILELAAKAPTSPIAFASLEWVVTNRQIQAGAPTLRRFGLAAVELLHDHDYATNSTIAPLCWGLGRNWDSRHEPTLEFLQEVIARNPNREARGNATFALACLLKQKTELLDDLRNAPDLLNDEWRKSLAEEAKITDPSTLRRQAEQLFVNVIQTYSNCPIPVKPKSTLGDRAVQQLYELQHLSIGQVAPEIQGHDLDGEKLKLSDYRGKVVLLSFWGSWCGPCMQMIPHEQKLAEGMAGKPFALIGVNSDVNPLDGKRVAEKRKVTWRSFWSGTNGSDGPIPTAWNVKAWPTVYMLDPKGTIRLKLEGYGGSNTDNLINKTVNQLLNEYGKQNQDGANFVPAAPQGGANGSPPVGAKTNSTSSATGSRRSPWSSKPVPRSDGRDSQLMMQGEGAICQLSPFQNSTRWFESNRAGTPTERRTAT